LRFIGGTIADMYSYVCVAGTFDGLHAGHEVLLLRAFTEGARVLIGVTTDAYVADHKPGSLRSYDIRVRELATWLKTKGYAERVTIAPIHDPFEPAVSDPALDALVVSSESEKRAVELNNRRKKLGLKALTLIVVPMLNAEDLRPISATRVRAGVIDRTGKLLMPESLREELTKPLGNVLVGADIKASFDAHKDRVIVTVGDRTAQTALEAGITPHLMIVDNKVNREDFFELQPVFTARNFAKVQVQSGPGFISHAAIDAVRHALAEPDRMPLVVEVQGEEDLLTIPAVIEAPLGAVVYYGQPLSISSPVHGVVEVLVTQESQQAAKALLSRFIRQTPLAPDS